MIRPMRMLLGVGVIAAVMLSACGGRGPATSASPTGGLTDPPPEVHVTGATITPTAGGRALVTFAAHNAGSQTDRLLRVVCECGGTATLLDADGTPADGVDIASEEMLVLGPGSAIVEIEALPQPLEPGSFVGLQVTFALAGEVLTEAEVAPRP